MAEVDGHCHARRQFSEQILLPFQRHLRQVAPGVIAHQLVVVSCPVAEIHNAMLEHVYGQSVAAKPFQLLEHIAVWMTVGVVNLQRIFRAFVLHQEHPCLARLAGDALLLFKFYAVYLEFRHQRVVESHLLSGSVRCRPRRRPFRSRRHCSPGWRHCRF